MSDEQEKKEMHQDSNQLESDSSANSNEMSPEAAAVRVNQPGQEAGNRKQEAGNGVDSENSEDQPGQETGSGKQETESADSEDEEVEDSKDHGDSDQFGEGENSNSSSEEKKDNYSENKNVDGRPKMIGKEKSDSRSNGRFLAVIGLTFVGLFVAFIFLMVLVIVRGGDASPVLAAFGLDPTGIKSFLLSIVNFSFGGLSLLFFVIAIIGVFKGLFAKKDDRAGRRKGLWMTILGIVPLIVLLFVWLYLFNLIGDIQIQAEQVKAEILVTEPADLSDLEAPLEVTFSSENVIISLQNRNLPITGVRWDLNGDGEFETTANDFTISYLYQNRGNYNVGLAVSIEGEEVPRTYFFPLIIQQAVFEAQPASGTPPLEVQFDASQLISDNVAVDSFDWDFNEDGVYDVTGKSEVDPSYTFRQVGTYRVHLRIVDENNLVQNYYREIEVIRGEVPPIAASIQATPSLSGSAPLVIRFDGEQSQSEKGKITSYEWDFGDGTDLQSGRSVSHTYNTAGDYEVTLTVKDDLGQEAISTAEVEVSGLTSAPQAIISTDPASEDGVLEGELPFMVKFDASDSFDSDDDIVDYEWNFGGNNSAVGEVVNFTFDEVGEYNVELTVRDADDQEDTTSLKVNVVQPGLRAVITAEPEEGTAPLNVRFDGSTSSAFEGSIVSYEWDFGDGSPTSVTGARITHRYEQVGNYTVRLKVTTNQNESITTEKTIFVREVPLRSCFTVSRNSGKAPLSVSFDSKCSTGTINNYKWDFGDGDTSESRSLAHTFDDPGSYSVTLEVFDDKNNVSSFSEVIEVEAEQ